MSLMGHGLISLSSFRRRHGQRKWRKWPHEPTERNQQKLHQKGKSRRTAQSTGAARKDHRKSTGHQIDSPDGRQFDPCLLSTEEYRKVWFPSVGASEFEVATRSASLKRTEPCLLLLSFPRDSRSHTALRFLPLEWYRPLIAG